MSALDPSLRGFAGAAASAGRPDVATTKCLRGGSLAVVSHGLEAHRGPLKVAMYCAVASRVGTNEEMLLLMGIDGEAIDRASRATARERWDL